MPTRSKLLLVADAGPHQHLRRLDRAQREHDLPGRLEPQQLALTDRLHADGLFRARRATRVTCVPVSTSEVGPVEERIGERAEDASGAGRHG